MKDRDPKQKKPNLLLRVLALLATAGLVLGALFLVANRDRYNLDALRRWIALRSVQAGGGEGERFTHGGGDRVSFACLNDGVVMVSTSGVHYYSFDGEQYAEQVAVLEHPVLSASATAAVAYDAGERTLWLYRGGEEAFSVTLEGGGDLLSARVNDSGWLAVTAQESGYKGAVTVYNSAHQDVFRVNRSSTFVVDAAVSPDCRSVALVTMGQQEGRFESRLLVYELDSEEPVADVELGSTAVLDLDYEQDTVWLLGEKSLITVSTGEWSVSSWPFSRSYLKGCSLEGDGFAMLLLGRYRAGAADQVVTIGGDGQAIASLNLRGQVLSYDAQGRYLALLSGASLDLYTSDLTPYHTLEDIQGARYTALTEAGSALLADRQQAWMYNPG